MERERAGLRASWVESTLARGRQRQLESSRLKVPSQSLPITSAQAGSVVLCVGARARSSCKNAGKLRAALSNQRPVLRGTSGPSSDQHRTRDVVDSLARRSNHARGAPAPSGLCARAAPVLLRRSGLRLGADGAGRSARAEPGGPAAAAQTCRLVSRRRAPGDVLACADIRLAFAAVVVRGLVTPPQRVPVLAARRTVCLALAAALRCIIGTPSLERVVVAMTRIAVLLVHRDPNSRSSRMGVGQFFCQR
jgi:hypothetical protein